MMVGVLLAAGASKRMGSPKPLVSEKGQSFLAGGIRRLWSACNDVVVVLGSQAPLVRRSVEEEFERLIESGALHHELTSAGKKGAAGLEVHMVVNAAWRKGMYSSVRTGLAEALSLDPEGVLVLPVDHPTVKAQTIQDVATVLRLALEACRTPEDRKKFSYALAPRYRRLRGHPVALSPALAQAVVKDVEAENLSDAVRRNARLLGYLDVTDAGVVNNRNTPEG